jgi:hypothetical protein
MKKECICKMKSLSTPEITLRPYHSWFEIKLILTSTILWGRELFVKQRKLESLSVNYKY